MTFQLKWLIDNTNSRDLENLAGKSSTINYHIQWKPFNGILDSEYSFYTYRIKGAKHKQSTRRWIHTIINHLDPIINVDFQHVKNAKKSVSHFSISEEPSANLGTRQQLAKMSGSRQAALTPKERPTSLPSSPKVPKADGNNHPWTGSRSRTKTSKTKTI